MVKKAKDYQEGISDAFRSANDIKNKTVKRKIINKELKEKRKEKKNLRQKRREAGEKPGIPHTIESLRVKDETVLDANNENEERIEEEQIDIKTDEYETYFSTEYEPKVLITFKDNPLKKSRIFGVELSRIIPNSLFRYRNRSSVKNIVKRAIQKKFSDVIVINEDMKIPNGFLLIHLPSGPTAYFRMSNLKLTPDLKLSHKDINHHRPEVILNNFTTRLGKTIARMLAALFHYDPEFKGRRSVTFHNQRDYIFFRHHRYEFKMTKTEKQEVKVRLKELGPRFTLRLEWLQEGIFDTILGEYLWIKRDRRHDLECNRRKFYL